jgi:type VI protein secretion system component VasF
MTEFESKCYGITEQEIREQYMQSITATCSGMEMVVMGMLSDVQEMMAADKDPARSKEYARKQLNIAKFILCEMMDDRVFKETA